VREQTDTQFFSPGAASVAKTRPILASAGLEQRDYKTLAAATHDLDVDVKICAVSPNASPKTQVAFPEIMPQNMTPHPQEWQQFRQLYRNADIVVVSLLDNPYSAGLTTLMEALACCRPVVITRTPGLAERFIDAGVVTGVNPGDVSGMRQAISELLNNPVAAAAQAEKGYKLLLKEHTSEHYVEDMVTQLQRIAEQQQLMPQSSYAVAI
jgi:glycosyltransferase involved in cell wall biosynthesis